MTDEHIEGLAEECRVSDVLASSRCSAGALLLPAILRILAGGQPASLDEIGKAVGLPAHLAVGVIAYIFPDAEFDADERLLGLGLSLLPTPHRVLLPGRDSVLYAWCAPDALLLPALIGQDAQITSPCHATGQVVTVMLGSAGVEEVRPANAMVSFMPERDPRNLRTSGCDNQHFFISAEAATAWLAEHPHAFIVPVPDAFRLLTHLSHQVFGAQTQGTVDIEEVLARLLTRDRLTDEIPCRLIAKVGDRFTTNSGQPEPGDMWWDHDLAGCLDSEAHRERGGGPHLVVRLPNEWDWDIDGPMSNGQGWWRTGEPPNVTALPSIVAGEYHGFLLKGKLARS